MVVFLDRFLFFGRSAYDTAGRLSISKSVFGFLSFSFVCLCNFFASGELGCMVVFFSLSISSLLLGASIHILITLVSRS